MRRDVVKKRSSSALQISSERCRTPLAKNSQTLFLFFLLFFSFHIFFDFWFDSSNGIKEKKKKQIIKSKISEYITPPAYLYTCPVSPSTIRSSNPSNKATTIVLELSERHVYLWKIITSNVKEKPKTSAMQWMMASYISGIQTG